jgi:hypothetical protein
MRLRWELAEAFFLRDSMDFRLKETADDLGTVLIASKIRCE